MSESQEAKSQSTRYYLGLWAFSLNEDVDFLSCAWHENGVWCSRTRFRYLGFEPRECRYTIPLLCTCDAEANAELSAAAKVANVSQQPIRRFQINGDLNAAVKVLSSDKNLFGRAMDDPALPVLYNQDCAEVAKFAVLLGPQPNDRRLAPFKEFVRDRAKVERCEPNRFGFWVLDFVGRGPEPERTPPTTEAK